MIRIFTDSASDIRQDQAAEMGVTVLPLAVSFPDGSQYLDGINLSAEEFYGKLTSMDKLPHTSQVTLAQYLDAYNETLAAGDDTIVITISSGLSGTYEGAHMAKNMLNPEDQKHIWVVDSKHATISQQLIVMEACKLREEGTPAGAIAATLEKLIPRVEIMGVVDTLEYLRRGGRISAAMAAMGGLLSIKPLIHVADKGIIEPLAKAREAKNAIRVFNTCVQRFGVDFDHPVIAGYSGISRENLDRYLDSSKETWSKAGGNIPVVQIAATIGTHVGPGAYAMAFVKPEAGAE